MGALRDMALPPEEEKELSAQEELEAMALEIEAELRDLGKKSSEWLKRVKKGEKITPEEQAEQKERWDIVKMMQKNYSSLYKMVYPKGNKNTPSEEAKPDMNKVMAKDSSVGSIIRKIDQ